MELSKPTGLTIKNLSVEDLPESIRSGGQETRAKIIKAAAKLFYIKSFYSTSMLDIANEANISRSNIYYHYRSKEKILADIYTWVLDRGIEMMRAIILMDVPPLKRLSLIIWYIAKAGSVDCYERGLLAGRLDPQGSVSKKDRQTILNILNEAKEMTKKLIIECINEGSIGRHIDPSVTTQLFFSSLHQIPVWYNEGGKFTSDQIADLAVDILINGLQVQSK